MFHVKQTEVTLIDRVRQHSDVSRETISLKYCNLRHGLLNSINLQIGDQISSPTIA